MVEITIDSKVRVRTTELEQDVIDFLKEACSIPNLEKIKAQSMDQWGWRELPDTIDLWSIDGSEIVLPRGFYKNLKMGLEQLGYELKIHSHTCFEFHGEQIGEPIDLRSWQRPQVEAIINHADGIVKAPAGSGKTVSVLGAIQILKGPAIVIVNTKDILYQWQERAETFLPGIDIGIIGDNKFSIGEHLTIATAQTLHSRYEFLKENGFFDKFTIMCLDECHHATADTYARVVDAFSANYRFGVSATPDKTGNFEIAQKILGPIIHTTKPEEVDSLHRPEVVRIPTNFRFQYRGHQNRWKRSNYPELIKQLTEDNERNRAIVHNIMANAGHHQLVISKRINHLMLIHAMLLEAGFKDKIVTIIGENDSEHRREAKAVAEKEPCVVLSTLADEALDIPRLDRLHMIYPQRNPGLITQQVGRIERVHDDKERSIIFDYADLKVGPLESQFRTRKLQVYEQRGYTISTMKLDELFAQ